MLIDWFTVCAQLVNFLILVWLLKYFLYGRILAAMNRREQHISDRWEQAEQAVRRSEEQEEQARHRNREFDANRSKLLAEAIQDAETERQKSLARIRSEMSDSQAAWIEAVEQERQAFLRELRTRAGLGACKAARRVLDELANASLEQEIARAFVKQITHLDHTQLEELIGSVQQGATPVRILSAFELPKELQSEVTRAVQTTLETDVEVSYEISPELTCGMELHTDSHQVAWGISSYLDALERDVERMIHQATNKQSSEFALS